MIPDEAVSIQKYNECKTWQERVSIISLFHTIQSLNNKNWYIKDTASHFGISIGLVSESVRLSMAMDKTHPELVGIKSREEALKLIERRHYVKDRRNSIHIKDK